LIYVFVVITDRIQDQASDEFAPLHTSIQPLARQDRQGFQVIRS
jgi:hypothetical protein